MPNFLENIFAQLKRADGRVVLREIRGKQFVGMTGSELLEQVGKVRVFLRSSGILPGERCALLAPNSIRWVATDLAMMAEGVIVVPLYSRQAPDELSGMMKDCQPRLAIFHHSGQFIRSLARIERHHNHSFRHHRQIGRNPPDGIRRQQRAALSRQNARAAQEHPHFPNLLEQFASRHANKLLAADFPQYDAAICPFQLRENIFEEIWHEKISALPPSWPTKNRSASLAGTGSR